MIFNCATLRNVKSKLKTARWNLAQSNKADCDYILLGFLILQDLQEYLKQKEHYHSLTATL